MFSIVMIFEDFIIIKKYLLKTVVVFKCFYPNRIFCIDHNMNYINGEVGSRRLNLLSQDLASPDKRIYKNGCQTLHVLIHE